MGFCSEPHENQQPELEPPQIFKSIDVQRTLQLSRILRSQLDSKKSKEIIQQVKDSTLNRD